MTRCSSFLREASKFPALSRTLSRLIYTSPAIAPLPELAVSDKGYNICVEVVPEIRFIDVEKILIATEDIIQGNK